MIRQKKSHSPKNQSPSLTKSMTEKQFYSLIHSRKKRGWYERYWQYYKWRLMRLREHPQKLARGLAVGTFAGCFPLFGLQMIIAVLLAVIFRGNKFTAMMGTWISNPFTYVPIFWFNFQVGKLILHSAVDDFSPQQIEFNWDSWQQLANASLDIIVALFIGSFLVGVVISFLAYFISLKLLKNQHKKSLKIFD